MKWSMACILALAAGAEAQLIETRAALDALLDDAAQLEDFEGFSIAGGTSVTAPNPLNADTQPTGWGILPGVSYASPFWLRVYMSFVWGDDSNVLAGGDQLTITFDERQQAVGFDLVNITGNLTYHDVVTFYRGPTVVGQMQVDLPPGSESFVGWQFVPGISHVEILESASAGWAIIDNVGFGLPSSWCAPDANADGRLDFFDVQAFLAAFAAHDPSADFNLDGQFDFFDVQSFLAAFSAGCP